ncbi:MAG: 50S ribosomal protein L24 [Patescibacteria group bacterium]|nr:50S ribosomal protein L24 [Patescibacteria group bacterium]
MNIKKGDQIKMMTGKDRGKSGAVLRVFPSEEKITVEGLNLYKKRARPKRNGEKGEMVTLPRPVHVSNAMIVCTACKRTTRVGHRSEGEKKVRVCKKCNASF